MKRKQLVHKKVAAKRQDKTKRSEDELTHGLAGSLPALQGALGNRAIARLMTQGNQGQAPASASTGPATIHRSFLDDIMKGMQGLTGGAGMEGAGEEFAKEPGQDFDKQATGEDFMKEPGQDFDKQAPGEEFMKEPGEEFDKQSPGEEFMKEPGEEFVEAPSGEEFVKEEQAQ
jgi:hypothetical protein